MRLPGRAYSVLAAALVVSVAIASLPQLHQVHSKFEFKHSFKSPYLVNSKGEIPFLSHGGSKLRKKGRGGVGGHRSVTFHYG